MKDYRIYIIPSAIFALWPFVLYPIGLIFDGVSDFRHSAVAMMKYIIHGKGLDWLVLLSWSLLIYVILFVRPEKQPKAALPALCWTAGVSGVFYLHEIGSGPATLPLAIIAIYLPIGFLVVRQLFR